MLQLGLEALSMGEVIVLSLRACHLPGFKKILSPGQRGEVGSLGVTGRSHRVVHWDS